MQDFIEKPNRSYSLFQIIYLVFIFSTLFLVSCVSRSPEIDKGQYSTYPPPVTRSKDIPRSITVDYYGLQNSLGLGDLNTAPLGYYEKAFQTCQVGHGFSSTSNCQWLYFVVIHFKLSCRHSEGTISVPLEKSDIHALDRRLVQWSLANNNGEVKLNRGGSGRLIGVFKKSPRFSRLKLGVANDNLYTRAGEIKSVITPYSWCN